MVGAKGAVFGAAHLALGGQLLLGTAGPTNAKEMLPQRTPMRHSCSRLLTRSVRKTVEKEVLRAAAKAGISEWPSGCPLDPKLDLYGGHEKKKQRKRPGSQSAQWTCGYCGKIFTSEHYLDLHMERRHMDEAPANGTCLADYCEIFQMCDVASGSRASSSAEDCNPEKLASAKRLCEDALMKCFPLDQEGPRRVHAQLSKHFCQQIDCRIREEAGRESDMAMVPVIVLLIFIGLVGFLVFSMVVCCVDYSDNILLFLKDSGIASTGCIRRLLKSREAVRTTTGFSTRTKSI